MTCNLEDAQRAAASAGEENEKPPPASPTGANICSSDSTCNVCDACCVNYFTVQAHCDGCVDSVC
jgi:hypothetical protein